MKFATLALLASLALTTTLYAQSDDVVESPKYELRSAWVATVPGLDFPSAVHPATEEALRTLIQSMKAHGMNAVIFQASPRGDAFYRSERLPWSHRLTGTLGQDPGWDPLEVAVDEAHKLGMELHAWYNFARIGDLGAHMQESEVPHVYFTNPEWIEMISTTQMWLNPGHPEAREWSIANVMEIVENYDVDAVHFDFIRYATTYSSDLALRDAHDPGMNLAHWRRENVSRFAMAVYDSVKAVKPWVKVGSTPVGHYQSSGGWAAGYGYSQYFSDSRRWLQEEKHDYLAPQLYWGIGNKDDAPRFEWLVNDWMSESYGRHIYVGTAPYKTHVKTELPIQIDTTRAHGVHGQIHFRYNDIRRGEPFADRYEQPSLVPPMDWLDMTPPPASASLSYEWSEEDSTVVELTWDPVEVDNGPHRYAVYRVYSDNEPNFEEVVDNPKNLIAVTGETTVTDSPGTLRAYYFVTTVSSNSIESETAPSVDLMGRRTSSNIEQAARFALAQNYPNPFNPVTTIGYEIEASGDVKLRVFNVLGQEVAVLVDEPLPAGAHTVQFDARHLPSGTYFYVLENGGRSQTKAMMLVK